MEQNNSCNDEQDHNENNKFLATEYQVCRQAADALSSSHWTYAGIFLSVITAGLAFIVPNIFLISALGFKIFVTAVSVGMLIIIFSVHSLLTRMTKRSERYYKRMREIEKKTGMMAQLIQEEKIGCVRGSFFWSLIIVTLLALWILAIIFTWSCQSAW